MGKVKELKIDSILWATPSKLVNLLDFKPGKISIKSEGNTKDDIKVHHVKYEDGGFYLVIDNLKGYFDFSHNVAIFINFLRFFLFFGISLLQRNQ